MKKVFFFCSGSKYPALKAIYDETNRKVEMFSKISHFLAKFIPIVAVLGRFMASLYIDLTADQTQDEFELPIPMW